MRPLLCAVSCLLAAHSPPDSSTQAGQGPGVPTTELAFLGTKTSAGAVTRRGHLLAGRAHGRPLRKPLQARVWSLPGSLPRRRRLPPTARVPGPGIRGRPGLRPAGPQPRDRPQVTPVVESSQHSHENPVKWWLSEATEFRVFVTQGGTRDTDRCLVGERGRGEGRGGETVGGGAAPAKS